MTVSIAILFVQYDQTRYPCSFQKAQTLLIQSLSNDVQPCRLFWVQLDNYEEDKPLQYQSENHILVGGDNSLHEFSAWSKGVEIVQKSTHFQPDVYLLITDAFMAYGNNYYGLLNCTLLEWMIQQNAVAGLIDPTATREVFILKEWEFWYWIRTSFLLIPNHIIKQGFSFVTFTHVNEFCPKEFDRDHIFLEDAPMSKNYQRAIQEWLTQNWHSAFDLSPVTWQRFQTKLRSILNEHALSIRLSEFGANFYDLRALQVISKKTILSATQLSRFDVHHQLELCRLPFWKRLQRKVLNLLKKLNF